MIGFLIVTVIAGSAGIILAVASIFMVVPKDERVEVLLEALPGINCGACGFSGCEAYAQALANRKAEVGGCPPSGKVGAQKLAAILGVVLKEVEEKVAIVHCQGHEANTKKRFIYDGVETCQGASMLYGGDKSCSFGCLGRGDCTRVCPSNALVVIDGLAVVKTRRCIGCGRCVKSCPKQLITLRGKATKPQVYCMNTHKGAETRRVCKTGCIGCFKCQKVCESNAVSVVNFCASIDESKCNNCGKCVVACPVKAII